MTNLDRLNELLQDEDLPTFRKSVGRSLNNLVWLRKHHKTANTELTKLLAMETRTLLCEQSSCDA